MSVWQIICKEAPATVLILRIKSNQPNINKFSSNHRPNIKKLGDINTSVNMRNPIKVHFSYHWGTKKNRQHSLTDGEMLPDIKICFIGCLVSIFLCGINYFHKLEYISKQCCNLCRIKNNRRVSEERYPGRNLIEAQRYINISQVKESEIIYIYFYFFNNFTAIKTEMLIIRRALLRVKLSQTIEYSTD